MATTSIFNHLDGHGFEERVCDILEAAGKGATTLQPLSNDQGFDIILITPNNRKIGIQCKHTAHRVGRPVLHNLLGASANKRFDEIWVITSNDFSHYAEEFADEMNQVGKYPIIKLIDGYTIGKLYRDNRLREHEQIFIHNKPKYSQSNTQIEYFTKENLKNLIIGTGLGIILAMILGLLIELSKYLSI